MSGFEEIEWVHKQRFKIESVQIVMAKVQHEDWLESIDLPDINYHIPISV